MEKVNLLGEVRLPEESPSTLSPSTLSPSTPAETPLPNAKEDALDDGWLGIWIFRFLVFYGCLFSCFAVIAVRLAAIPQHVLLFTRSKEPSLGDALTTFMTLQWMTCFQALGAQVLWNFMTSMVSQEKPLVKFRTARAKKLGVSTSLVDSMLAVFFVVISVVCYELLKLLDQFISPFVALAGATYMFCFLAVIVHQLFVLWAKYAGNSRAQLWDQLRHSDHDDYKGLRWALAVLAAQAVVGIAAFGAMHIAGTPALKDLVCVLSLFTLPCLMIAFSLVFNYSIQNQTQLGECNTCCCRGSHCCGSFFSAVCTVCLISLLIVYTMESKLVQAVFIDNQQKNSEGKSLDDARLLSGGHEWNMSYISPSEAQHLGTYPVCKMHFGSVQHNLAHRLTPLDLALFAEAAYIWEDETLNMTVQSAFAGTELAEWSLVVDPQDPTKNARVVHWRQPKAGVDVIAIRGSQIAQDWAYNAYIWAPGLFWNVLMNYVMPFGHLMGVQVGQLFLASSVFMGSNIADSMYVKKLKYVKERVEQARSEGFTPVITGHSLGGGLAATAGSLFDVPALVFSSIGLTYSESRVRWAMEMWEKKDDPVMNHVVRVIPVGDPVPMLEPLLGMAQQIHCGADLIRDRNPMACHSLKRTMCELHRKCGDPRGRTLNYCVKEGFWEPLPWQNRSP